MPSWEELQNYVRKNLRMLSDQPNLMVLGWQHTESDGTLVRQAVSVFEMTAYKEPWLILLAEVCPEEALSEHEVLRLNGELTFGGLVKSEAGYALRYTMSIKALPLDDILVCIERLAWAAVALRQQLLSAAQGDAKSEDAPAESGGKAVVHTHWTE
jgi:hypothetical protein